MKISTSLFFLLSLFPSFSYAQSVTLSGYITVANSGEAMIGATVGIPSLGIGAYTNTYGFYSLTVPAQTDSVEVRVSFIGFAPFQQQLLLTQNRSLDVELVEEINTLETVEIIANSLQDRLNSTEMSVDRISISEAKRLPAFLGEIDILKTLQLKPGVSSGSEGSSGIFVRGGGPDQNLVLLDGTTVYNPSHLFGFFSTFNSDAIKDVKLYKGGFPAQYGGRLSSVIDVKLNEGNRKHVAGAGGLGLIASRLTLEGPLVKDKSSFIVAGRRTYVDLFTRMINEANADNPDASPIPDYYFYDLNAKINYELGEKDQIYLSGYFGRDRFNFNDGDFDIKFFWGNANGTLRWNHIFNPRLYVNVAVSISDYLYTIQNTFDVFDFELGSDIRDYGLRADFTYLPNNKHIIRWGVGTNYREFTVGRLDAGSEDGSIAFEAGDDYFGTEMGVYVSDEWEVNNRLKITSGLRVSGFESQGEYYYGIEPRVAAKYSLSPKVSLKASYARMVQYLHLVTNSGASLPTDVWYPSNPRVPPQRSHQIAGGISLLLNKGKYLITNEVYYKWLENQVDFRDAANLFVNNDLDSEFVFGDGYAYGNELYIEKTQGRLTGWLGYTYAWAWRQFDGSWRAEGEAEVGDAINGGNRFHPRNDRRHDFSIVLMYDLSKRLTASLTWEYRTGNATTLPIGRYISRDVDVELIQPVPIYQERNSFRMPAYHKMDAGLIWKFFPRWGESNLTISLYNVYNRRNAYFIYFEAIESNNSRIPIAYEAKQVALFPIIPSISYNFQF